MSQLENAPDPRPTRRRTLGARHFIPLAGFVLPTVLIGYGIVIPRSCIAGVNELTIGFATTVVGACFTYWAGIRLALRGEEKTHGEA